MKRLLVVICLLVAMPGIAMAQGTGGTATGPDEGMAAYDRGDYETALAIWQRLADAGNPVAQFNVGNLYLKGLGVPRDPERAARYYEQAAAQGHGVAQYNLAVMYASGTGVARDYQQAMDWIDKALVNIGDEDRQLAQQARSFIAARLAEERALAASEAAATPATAAAPAEPASPPAAPETAAPEPAEAPTAAPAARDRETARAAPAPAEEPSYTEAFEAAPVGAEGTEVADSDQLYTVQLASYRMEDGANEGWRRLSKEHPDLLGGLDHTVEFAVLDDGTGIYRLRVGRFSGFSAANALCSQLKAAGSDCLVVRITP